MKVEGFIKGGHLKIKCMRVGNIVITTKKALQNIRINGAELILFERKKKEGEDD